MPRHPRVAPTIRAMEGRVYSSLARRLAKHSGEVYPLHIGDTWMEPPDGCRMEDLSAADHPGMHRYAPVQGTHGLLDTIVEWTEARSGGRLEREQVLVATGATGGLGAVVGALLAPGDEVLILAPYWPLIAGIVRTFRAQPVPVPILDIDDPEALVEALEDALSPRTAALYYNTPHNPTGRVLSESLLAAMADFARRNDLWVVSDDVYEHYSYDAVHVRGRLLAPERTFAAHSFSKAYGMAGNRCGYVLGPSAVMRELRKVSTHTFYSTPTASQIAAQRALLGPGDAWAARAAALYADTGRKAAARLGLPPPQGSTFLFLDVADRLDERGLLGFLDDCVERGLLVAQGTSFGPYPTHIRLCFTSVEPERVLRGVEVLAGILGR
ncbi:MAG: pyridoxal phosphate-dependent aminotransferase [Deltaproteobacteria bacterium]|nr:pyridoxal phosphate-dependent aminotransferase [Deltaproteobacteria bacterium]